jgi:hypothetical protein
VYNTWDYWAFGLCLSYGIQRNIRFQKLDQFPSSGEEVGDTCSVRSFRKKWPQPLDNLQGVDKIVKTLRNLGIEFVLAALKELHLVTLNIIYMWVFIFPVKHNKNKHQITHSNSSLHIWVYFGCTVLLHVSAHGAIIRQYINKSYTIELCFLYGSIHCVFFLSCVTNKAIIQLASLTFVILQYMPKLSGSILNLNLIKMYKTSI